METASAICLIRIPYNKIRACLKNHSHNLHAPLCGSFHPNSVAVARYGALIRAKSPTNCDAHLAESLFQTRSRTKTGANTFCLFLVRKRTLSDWLKASYQTRLYVFQERNSFFTFILFVIFMFFKEILCFLYDYTA